MRRINLIITLILLVGILPALTFAYHGRHGKGPMEGCKWQKGDPNEGGCGMLLRLKDKLELNEEQVQKLEAIQTEVSGDFKAAREAVKTKRQALWQAVESGASADVIRTAANELGTAIGDKAVLKAETKTKIDAVLTDTQKATLQEMKEQRKERWQEKMSKGERPRRPDRRRIARDPEAVFERIDTNNDGSVSLEEFEAHMEQMKARRGDKGPTPPEPNED